MYDRDKRRQEIEDTIESFKEMAADQGQEIEIPANTADAILDTYEILLSDILRSTHEEGIKINIFKVAAGIETAINYKQPIKCKGIKERIVQNAFFGSHFAFTFIFAKHWDGDPFDLTESEEAIILEHNHLMVMSLHDSLYDYTILANSMFWKALHYGISQRTSN
ncbi:hypothetical protein SAMN05216327_104264 [Dyadobacter sp. SG02]|uniref:hypothetical protein n=1 Tax=Dyadobacter sp. SG02 TaxID=1855291 RepID=UPI0008CF30CE|nr:hypothetical protein [Dyadobacter sp. SG02]SEI86036.1 hypothetical protein SAMN05216327_104264 [Dyadobacter sp. SG02]